jgi:hypothetical protein
MFELLVRARLFSQANCAVFDDKASAAITAKRQAGKLSDEEKECCDYYYFYCHAT